MKGVVLGVSGGIAAYKAVEVVRRLCDQGIRVQVVMTANAQKFVQPLTFQALSNRRVITGMFDLASGSEIEHVQLRQEYDLLLVAPATADILGKFAHGIADDFLSTLYLAWTKEVLVAPAMNAEMYGHPALQQNLRQLKERHVQIVEPEEGHLACGAVGTGRLAGPARIVEQTQALLDGSRELEGKRVLVNAGPTIEAIDPVRYLSNRSSGKMGYALAAEAARRGAQVTLVSGPVVLNTPNRVQRISVRTAAEMGEAMEQRFPHADIAILAAAICDFTPRLVAPQKIKSKSRQEFHLELVPTKDILAALGRLKKKQILVGFAAETENLLENALRKLQEKNVDLMIANDVSHSDRGLESDDNQVSILFPDSSHIDLPKLSKREVARKIIDILIPLLTQDID